MDRTTPEQQNLISILETRMCNFTSSVSSLKTECHFQKDVSPCRNPTTASLEHSMSLYSTVDV